MRLQLTGLYGLCFLGGSVAVLALTYLIVAHVSAQQTRQLTVHGIGVRPPASPITVLNSSRSGRNGEKLAIKSIRIQLGGREELVVGTPPASSGARPGTLYGGRYMNAQLASLQQGNMAFLRCMRARGLRFPNQSIARGPGGLGYRFRAVGAPPLSDAEQRSTAFRTAIPRCVSLYVSRVPLVPAPSRSSRHATSALRGQIDVVVDRANRALTAQRHRSLATLLTWSVVALGLAAILSILSGWLIAGRGLRPIRAMSTRARQITEDNLHERLSTTDRDDELGELAATFDDVLTRLQHAFAAQRRFVANASHELRTPVTVERTVLEVALATPGADAVTLRRACEQVLASTKQQDEIIEALLVLARSQAGSAIRSAVNLSDLVDDALLLRERQLMQLEVRSRLMPAPVLGDPGLLERLVANLLDNAIVHNETENAWITIDTDTDMSGSQLIIANGGPRIAAETVPELFEPFRRLGRPRTAARTGVGLGLSIVQAIVDIHEATITAQPLPEGGLRLELSFVPVASGRASRAPRTGRGAGANHSG